MRSDDLVSVLSASSEYSNDVSPVSRRHRTGNVDKYTSDVCQSPKQHTNFYYWLENALRKTSKKKLKTFNYVYTSDGALWNILMKTVIVVYMFTRAWYIYDVCDYDPVKFSFYFTHWAWMMALLYFVFSLIRDVSQSISKNYDPAFLRIACHLLFESAFIMELLATLTFWIFVYPYEPWRRISFEIHMHLMGFLIMLADGLFWNRAFSISGHICILVLALIYTIWFEITTLLLLSKELYKGVNGRNLKSATLLTTAISFGVITHGILVRRTLRKQKAK